MKTITAAALGAACALFICPPHAGAAGELQRARAAAALGSRTQALDIAFEGLNSSPPDRELFLYAVELAPEGRTKYSSRLAAAARYGIAAYKEDYAWYLGLCKAERSSPRPQEALPNCRKALELDPTAYPAYRELGLTYAAAGSRRKAVETLEQGVELSSSDFQAYYHLARILENGGDLGLAASYYSKGLALAGKDTVQEAGYYRALLEAGLKRSETRKPARAAAAKPPAQGRRKPAAACPERSKRALLQDAPAAALAQIDACIRLAPSDPGLAAERAPLLVRLGKYGEGLQEYLRAAELYGGKNAAGSVCRVKAAETYLKMGNSGGALEQFKAAAAADPRNIDALRGLAAAYEAGSDFTSALRVYGDILKLAPSDSAARARVDQLKTGLLTDEQVLEELKFRAAVDEKKTALRPEDMALFKAIKAAEAAGAVDYVKREDPGARGLTAEKETPEGTRLLLTGAGFKAYIFYSTRDAVKFFEGRGIGLREIFQLKDLSGAPIFDPSGKLTPEGSEAWRGAAAGAKTWLMPYEPAGESQQAERVRNQMEEEAHLGYREISEPEYLWLLRETNCPEDVLRKDPVNLKTIPDGKHERYLLCYIENTTCMNAVNRGLPSLIESYRNGNTAISDAKRSTAFFGSGAVKQNHFCENGKLWNGE